MLALGTTTLVGLSAEAAAGEGIGVAVCTAVRDTALSDDCWKRLVSEQCDHQTPGYDACLTALSEQRANPALVQWDNFEKLSDAIVTTTSGTGTDDLEFTASFSAGSGSDVPATRSARMYLSCAAGISVVSLGPSRPPAGTAVEVFLDGEPFETGEWIQFRTIVSIGREQAERLLAAMRDSNSAAFTMLVADNQPYKMVFDMAHANEVLWPFDYLCR